MAQIIFLENGGKFEDDPAFTVRKGRSSSAIVFDTYNQNIGDHQSSVSDYTALAVHQNQSGELLIGKFANTLNTNGNASGRNAPLVAIGTDSENYAIAYDCRNHAARYELSGTIQAKNIGGHSLNYINPVFAMQGFGDYKQTEISSTLKGRDYKSAVDLVNCGYRVRRLTPTECERLQGFPDGWTASGHDGKKISDSARYKALGNSVAVPCVEFILGRMAGSV